MDPALNPFAPGAGAPPPELAGREEILASASLALRRVKGGRNAKSQMLLGLRGVGKTVLLNQIAELAEAEGLHPVSLESPEHEALADLLVPKLRALLLRLSRSEKTKDRAKKTLGVLRAFATAFKAKVGDVEFTVAPAVGVADSGSLEYDLPDLFVAVGETMREVGSALVLCIDEVQYLGKVDLSALIVAVHKLSQKGLPFLFFGAGLPQVATLAGEAKSYAERLFDYPKVGALSVDGARDAILKPLEREGVGISDHALTAIVAKTHAFPYFLQEWGSHVWNVTETPPINVTDVEKASLLALTALDNNFFHVRYSRLTERERDYARAMASLGPGPHRSGEIAAALGIAVTSAAPFRNELIKKGMVFSPQHGDTEFTVPMFDDFLIRTLPAWKPPKAAPMRPSARRRPRS